MLWLTIYFFGGFLAMMVCFACIALFVLSDQPSGYVVSSILTALSGLLVAFCAHEAWRILRVDISTRDPADSRLED